MARHRKLSVVVVVALLLASAGGPESWGQDLPTADVRLRVDLAPISLHAPSGETQDMQVPFSSSPGDSTVSQAVWVQHERDKVRDLSVQPANAISHHSNKPSGEQLETASYAVSNSRSSIRSSLDEIPLEPPKTDVSMTHTKGTSGSGILSMVASLMIVIGGFLGFAWFTKKLSVRARPGLAPEAVGILGQLSVSPGQNLLVIRFGKKLLLVHQQGSGCQTLSEIDNAAEVARLSELCTAQKTASPAFEPLPWSKLVAWINGKRGHSANAARMPYRSVGGPIE